MMEAQRTQEERMDEQREAPHALRLVLLTGMSGAGRSTAARALSVTLVRRAARRRALLQRLVRRNTNIK